jgi:hypothetical protein
MPETVPVICVTWAEFNKTLPTVPRSGGLPRRALIIEAFAHLLSPLERVEADKKGMRVRPQTDLPSARIAHEAADDTYDAASDLGPA